MEAFRDGWFYPGDLAQLDTDGFLTLTGRAKDMIIRGRINIYPEEIEATLMAHPAVADAAVIGLPYPARGEEAVAFAVLCGQAGETALRAWCRERLAADCVTGDQTLTAARLPSSAQIAIV